MVTNLHLYTSEIFFVALYGWTAGSDELFRRVNTWECMLAFFSSRLTNACFENVVTILLLFLSLSSNFDLLKEYL